MDGFQKPVRGHLSAYPGFSRSQQHLASHSSKLQPKTHVVAETGDRILILAPRHFAVHQLGQNREIIPDAADLLGAGTASRGRRTLPISILY